MHRRSSLLLLISIVLLGIAGWRFVEFLRSRGHPDELAFFYDLSEKRLFTAARTNVPPIQGLNDAMADAVRAVVISTSGDPADSRSRRIAYLEKYAPELKGQIEGMQSPTGEGSPAGARIGRGAAQMFTFVRRIEDEHWHAVNTPEAEQIMTEWQRPDRDGRVPVVCAP
jgi:hypothetical protein